MRILGLFRKKHKKAEPTQSSAQVISQTKVEPKISKKQGLGLIDPSHIARSWVDKASQIADQVIMLEAVGTGTGTMMQVNSANAMRLVSAIDEALQKSPDDLDLLVAKSGALCCAMQFKTAEEVLDQVLSISPEHFEARMRKDHWETWQHLFAFPTWSDKATTLHSVMAAHLQQARQIQIIRDGLQVGIAIVKSVQRQEFPPQGLSSRMRSKWEPVWSDTPYGAIVAHYLLVEDVPADPWKNEGFLPTFVPDEVIPASGYWLLQRMSNIGSCFLVLAEGKRILYNKRYVFPSELGSTLRSISQKVTQKAAGKDLNAFQNACQWHMQNFDMGRVRF
jgi:hypothetical protein